MKIVEKLFIEKKIDEQSLVADLMPSIETILSTSASVDTRRAVIDFAIILYDFYTLV